jgi:FMN phosphatase YigB (HAD superfamily)
VPERASPAPRAVVFDLDDTLFDAFGQCVRPAQREAAAAMRAAGLRRR